MSGNKHNGVLPLKGANNPDRELDVIFVHGLGGDAESTWRSAENEQHFWPDWLAEDFETIGVWSIDYGAHPSRWIDNVMPMEDRALNLLNDMSIKHIGNKPIVFITHSMGGLITKHILDQAQHQTNTDYKRIADNTCGVVFLAVPHNGDGWANALDAAGLLVRGNQLIEQLKKDNPGLRRLSNAFTQFVNTNSLNCCSFFETKEVRVKRKWIGSKGIKIVSESSARGSFPQDTPIGLDDDHLSICKLDSREDQLYGNMFKFIGECLANTDRSATSTASTQAINKPDASVVNSPKIQISKLPHTNSELFGRETELELLGAAWNNPKTNLLTIKAMGGTGKTALMQTWINQLAQDNYRGANAVYTWSFYSQGAAEDKQVSADEFFAAALQWFAYQGEPIPSAHDKGLKLAELINLQRTLILLDGLEPLQYPLGGAMDGALRDEGLKTLFKQLAVQNKGLLIISSRQDIIELAAHAEPLAILHTLEPLSISAGSALFSAAKIRGTEQEFADTVTELNGHALSLNLLATYLSEYQDSDIRQRSNLSALTDFPEQTRETRHAFKVMAAYEKQLHNTPELQILYMLGLFDRPVSRGAIDCLRDAAIEHISQTTLDHQLYQAVIKRLRAQDLLNQQNPEHPDTLDTHPLIREYFGKRLQQHYPQAWQQAHRQLYDYYKALPEKELPDTLNEMEPLFAALAHGCAAGLHQTALYEVYYPRILREDEHYLPKKLGAFGADLSAISHFFAQHWLAPAAALTDDWKAAVLNWAAFDLRALGRLQEAVQPMQAGLDLDIEQEKWSNAASVASSLSELQLTRGEVVLAIQAAEQSVELADKSGDEFYRMAVRTTLADAQHQSGDLANARQGFEEAETLQKQRKAEYPQLYCLPGFRYCDLLLAAGEWQEVQQRAEKWLNWRTEGDSLLDHSLEYLTLGRASLQQAIADYLSVGRVSDSVTRQSSDSVVLRCANTTYEKYAFTATELRILNKAMQNAENWLNQAVEGLRKAGVEDYLTRGLLARASYHRYALSFNSNVAQMELMESGEPYSLDPTAPHCAERHAGYTSALQDLQEAHDIAQRGGMRLHLTDYHLEIARLLFTAEPPNFKQSAAEHVTAAKQLIADTGYKRRLPELTNLEQILETIQDAVWE